MYDNHHYHHHHHHHHYHHNRYHRRHTDGVTKYAICLCNLITFMMS